MAAIKNVRPLLLSVDYSHLSHNQMTKLMDDEFEEIQCLEDQTNQGKFVVQQET